MHILVFLENQLHDPAIDFIDNYISTEIVILIQLGIKKTKFTIWMTANSVYEEVRQLTYVEFPLQWVWYEKKKNVEEKDAWSDNYQNIFHSPSKRKALLPSNAFEHHLRKYNI